MLVAAVEICARADAITRPSHSMNIELPKKMQRSAVKRNTRRSWTASLLTILFYTYFEDGISVAQNA